MQTIDKSGWSHMTIDGGQRIEWNWSKFPTGLTRDAYRAHITRIKEMMQGLRRVKPGGSGADEAYAALAEDYDGYLNAQWR